jgi:hypothetical protein
MSSHSEEIWESFDAMWRQIKLLSRQVKDLEARLAALEAEEINEGEEVFGPLSRAS